MRKPLTILLTLAAVAIGGCANYTTPTAPERARTEQERNFESAWFAAHDVLREYDFTLDRQDRRAGILSTLPLTGAHGLELWRKDAVTSSNLAEGTVQTIFRTATVTLSPSESDPNRYVPAVRVNVLRADRGTPQATSSADIMAVFGAAPADARMNTGPRDLDVVGPPDDEERLRAVNVTPPGMVPLGRDANLEARLAAEIADTTEQYRTQGR